MIDQDISFATHVSTRCTLFFIIVKGLLVVRFADGRDLARKRQTQENLKRALNYSSRQSKGAGGGGAQPLLAVVEYDDTDGDSVRFYFDEAKGTLK